MTGSIGLNRMKEATKSLQNFMMTLIIGTTRSKNFEKENTENTNGDRLGRCLSHSHVNLFRLKNVKSCSTPVMWSQICTINEVMILIDQCEALEPKA